MRIDEVESRETQLEHKEKRLAEEKTFYEQQLKQLEGELEKQRAELLASKREAGHKLAGLSQVSHHRLHYWLMISNLFILQDLASQTEEARNALRSKNILMEESQEFQTRAEDLAEKLRDSRESERKLEEKFRAELAAQTRLANLYKSHSEEHNNKVEDLKKVVTNLQNMLKEREKENSVLKEELGGKNGKHEEELAVQTQSITALKKELENANKLLKTIKEKGLSEESIESLSPSAAHASKLLKSGLTVTGIYSQMVALGEDLQKEKAETSRLNLYIQQILQEFETRAPQLKKQREEYERLAASVGGLTETLEKAREEVENQRSEAGEAKRRLHIVEKEKSRLEQQVADLGKQVSCLLTNTEKPGRSIDASSVDSVIAGRLLTFSEVSELQQRNIELLAVVRELSAGQEAAEQTKIEEKTAEVKQELDTALRQVEELRTARERQQLMVENLIQQKETYKAMVSGNSSTAASKMVDGDRQKLLQDLERTKKDFAEYKEGKTENDRISSEITEKLREDLHEAKLKLAKLSSQEEYNSEKFKIMTANLESSKKHQGALEDRNKQLQEITAKHEVSVTLLRKELMECQNQLSKAETDVGNLEMKKRHLEMVQSRLEAEREVHQKEKSSAAKIEAHLQQININLKRNDEVGQLKLQADNEKLNSELNLLRTKLESEQEHFKESVKTWELANKTLREKSEKALESEKNALEQLNTISTTLETMKMELKDTSEQLQAAESRLAGRGLGRQGSLMEGQGETGKSRLRDVELLMAQTKQELKSVTVQLAEAKRKGEEYRGISEAAEKRMVESSAAMQELQSQLETKVKKAEEEKTAMEKKTELMEIENKELKTTVSQLESEAGTSGGELRDRVRTCLTDLEEIKARLAISERAEREARENAEKWQKDAKCNQEKYENEIVQHARDIEALKNLKDEIKSTTNTKADLDMERNKFEQKLKQVEENHTAEVGVINQEKESLDKQLELVTAQNKNLMEQLENVSKQLSDMTNAGLNTSGVAADTSMVSNVSLDEESANNSQLMAIIKYLRQEKEIMAGRLEVTQAETARLQSQLEHQQRLVTESQTALEMERSNQSQSVMSASKHSDLIRKVETLSAVTDSNRMLREEKDRFEKENEKLKEVVTTSESKIAPLEDKLKQAEEKLSTVVSEKLAAQADADKWKKRSDQLVEKSFKINPKELARLQDVEINLTKSVSQLEAEKKQLEVKVNTHSKEVEAIKRQLATTMQEKTKAATDSQEKMKEVATVKRENVLLKNSQTNLQKESLNLKKKLEDLSKSHTVEMAKMKKEIDVNKAGGDDVVNNLKKELEEAKTATASKDEEQKTLRESLATKEAEMKKLRENAAQLKKIGTSFRTRFQAEETKNKTLTAEKEKLDEEIAKLKSSEAPSEGSSVGGNEELDEAHKLLEQSHERIANLEAETEELKKEKEELAKKNAEKEARAKLVLGNAKERITRVENENKELKVQLDTLSSSGSGSGDEGELRRKAIASQLTSVRQDKDKMEVERNEAVQEKEKLLEQVENLQQELVATQHQLAAQKPVAAAGVIQQPEKSASAGARKQQQPTTAHIQPHRHNPPREFTQTASIRPMAQRATSQAVVLPSQVSSAQVEVATVQPTVTVSPSNPQQPSTSQPQLLDPTASEYIPVVSVASGSSDSSEDTPRAVITPRQDQPQASTSSPSVAVSVSSTPTTSSSTSGTNPGAPTTASVPPTLKRPRDSTVTESDSVSSEEDRAGPSGQQKKPRTISSTESFQVSSGGAEVVEMSGVAGLGEIMESDSTGQERREVGSSSSVNVDLVGTSGEIAASSGVATSSQEEILEDQDQELEEDDEGEISEGLDDGDGQDLNPENLGEMSEEDNGPEEEGEVISEEEEIEVEQPEDVVEDNSSEPSSSTGTRQSARALASQPASSGYDEQGESDGVVPTTPKLPLPRRNDGFAEAVSSPQVNSLDLLVLLQ